MSDSRRLSSYDPDYLCGRCGTKSLRNDGSCSRCDYRWHPQPTPWNDFTAWVADFGRFLARGLPWNVEDQKEADGCLLAWMVFLGILFAFFLWLFVF